MVEIVERGVISQVPGRGAYMPVITPFFDGNFIACQEADESLRSPDNHIEVLRSGDGGETWLNQGSIHDGWAYRASMISVISDGRPVMNRTRFAQSETICNTITETIAYP